MSGVLLGARVHGGSCVYVKWRAEGFGNGNEHAAHAAHSANASLPRTATVKLIGASQSKTARHPSPSINPYMPDWLGGTWRKTPSTMDYESLTILLETLPLTPKSPQVSRASLPHRAQENACGVSELTNVEKANAQIRKLPAHLNHPKPLTSNPAWPSRRAKIVRSSQDGRKAQCTPKKHAQRKRRSNCEPEPLTAPPDHNQKTKARLWRFEFEGDFRFRVQSQNSRACEHALSKLLKPPRRTGLEIDLGVHGAGPAWRPPVLGVSGWKVWG